MTRRFLAVAASLVAVSVALAEGGAEAQELAGPFPVAESPRGDFPVGHWDCWFEHWDFDQTGSDNRGWEPTRCAVALFYSATVLELLPNGKGWMLAVQTPDTTNQDFDPDEAFRIPGVERLHSRAGEIRWNLDDDGAMKTPEQTFDSVLHIQTTINQWFGVEVLSDDMMRLGKTSHGSVSNTIFRILVRKGTAASRAMERFRDCVRRNDGRNLFDVEPCENPLPVSARVAGP